MKLPKFSFDKLIHKLTGRTWNYHVTFRYNMNPGVPNTGYVTNSMTMSVTDRNELAFHRNLKKALVPNMIKELSPQYRTNGSLFIEQLTYIGWFKPRPQSTIPIQTRHLGHKKRFGQMI